jgi:phosphoribosylformylglycinamidine synthase PurS subunit
MNFTAHVHVMPLKDLLDPQGKAVMGGLANLGIKGVQDVRVGKRITLQVEASDKAQAQAIAEACAQKLLCNAVMEYYEIHID